jgi:hypothetical protein
MKKILLCIPYFGDFPPYFKCWLSSVASNSTINWLLLTDNLEEYQYPENLRVINTSFDDFKKQIQQKFDFEISLDAPYKICDYRPAFGYVLNEYIDGYDFWGYTDIDMIYGDIRKFLNDNILESYSKLFRHGHLTIIKNQKEYNELFLKRIPDCMYHKDVYTSNTSCFFDENGLNEVFKQTSDVAKQNPKIYKQGGFCKLWEIVYPNNTYSKYSFDDIAPQFERFSSWTCQYAKNSIYTFSHGKLFRHYTYILFSLNIYKEELIYVHIQKRKILPLMGDFSKEFILSPNKISTIKSPINTWLLLKESKWIKNENLLSKILNKIKRHYVLIFNYNLKY